MIHMGWKCTPQVVGLVRGEAKQGQKHRSNVTAIVAEAGTERVSNSDTLDRNRTHLNRYTGFSSGFECADYITKEADNYRQEVTGKGGTNHYRKLRADAVIGYAVIYNPPEEICKNWTDEEYNKFYEDSRAVMEQIQPDIFRRDTIVMSAEHFDEGTITNPEKISRHVHDIGIPKNRDGHYCGTKIDAKLCADINKNYPRLMREKGWDIDDLDCTDWDRYKTDEDYRKERKSKKKSGKSVNSYIADKMRKQMQRNEDMSVSLQNAISEALELAEDKNKVEALQRRIDEDIENLEAMWEQLEQEKEAFAKHQEKKEKDFQHKEDALEAQKLALEKEQMRYKLSLKSKFEEKYRNYKADCDEKVRIALEKVNALPDMSEVVERTLDSAYVKMRLGEDMPARTLIEKQQQWNKRQIEDIVTENRSEGFDFEI